MWKPDLPSSSGPHHVEKGQAEQIAAVARMSHWAQQLFQPDQYVLLRFDPWQFLAGSHETEASIFEEPSACPKAGFPAKPLAILSVHLGAFEPSFAALEQFDLRPAFSRAFWVASLVRVSRL
jgi:hypothetical protein